MKNYWKRFSYFDKGLAAFFMINLVFQVIDNEILNSMIPENLVDYLFWLSLGLYIGFQLSKSEYRRAIRLISHPKRHK